jgi:hypothetical protein
MSENKMRATRSGEQQEPAKQSACVAKSSAGLVLKVVGGMALAAVAVGLISSLHDIRRYIRISTM